MWVLLLIRYSSTHETQNFSLFEVNRFSCCHYISCCQVYTAHRINFEQAYTSAQIKHIFVSGGVVAHISDQNKLALKYASSHPPAGGASRLSTKFGVMMAVNILLVSFFSSLRVRATVSVRCAGRTHLPLLCKINQAYHLKRIKAQYISTHSLVRLYRSFKINQSTDPVTNSQCSREYIAAKSSGVLFLPLFKQAVLALELLIFSYSLHNLR